MVQSIPAAPQAAKGRMFDCILFPDELRSTVSDPENVAFFSSPENPLSFHRPISVPYLSTEACAHTLSTPSLFFICIPISFRKVADNPPGVQAKTAAIKTGNN